MEGIIVTILILTAILGIELQYIVGKLATPPNMVYLGTVHWPSDYFYYLSQFAQGTYNFLSSTMLFTPEKLKPVLVGWQNVLTGRILTGLGLDVILAYQVAVAVYLGVYLVVSYFLLREIFPQNWGKRLLALFLFITSNSMFQILPKAGGGWEFSYWTHWYNLGISLARFGPTPHHLIAYSLGTYTLLLTVFWVKNGFKKKLDLSLLAASGFLLSSINPVTWGLTTLAASVAGGLMKKLKYLVPGVILLLAGVLPAIYVKSVFSVSPYLLSSAWESAQQLKMTPLWLFYNSGLIVILAILGIWQYWRKPSWARLLVFIFLSFAVFFYLSGVPEKIRISNARFWPSQVYIPIAVLATEGIIFLSSRFKRIKVFILVFIIIIYCASLLPTYYVQYKDLLTPKINNSYYYIPKNVYLAIIKARDISTPQDIFLVQWPYNEPFPGLTGRKTVFGFDLFTINISEKVRDAFSLIDGKASGDEVSMILKKYRISHLLLYSANNYFRQFPIFEPVYDNKTMVIYKVNL